ncbi:MAG TPA: DinB family protein [Bacteroidota bacterium]
MNTAQRLVAELQQESAKNRLMLDKIPEAKLSWKPHEKSMTIGRLGMHIAELPGWIVRSLTSEEYEIPSGPYSPNIPQKHAQIMEEFDHQLLHAAEILRTATDETLSKNWKVRKGDRLIYDLPRAEVIRRQMNHIIHHRGQLSVFLRLLDIPVPGTYGPTADEK